MRILDGYIAKETLWPVVFGVSSFTSIFVGSELIDLANFVVKSGAPLGKAVLIFLYELPQIFVWTFPMAVLLATLLSLSRLSSTSEIIAMQAGGVSLYRVIAPVLVIALLVTGASFFISEKLVPTANERSTVLMTELSGGSMPTITRNVILKRHERGVMNWFLYAARFDAKTQVMHDVTMVTLQNGQPIENTYAERIVWDETGWFMENGVTNRFQSDGEVTTMHFQGGRQPVDIGQKPKEIVRAQKDPEEMNIRELSKHISILESQGQDVREFRVKWHSKLAMPFASLVFAFVGAPLGIQPHRSATSIGFGLSVVIIFVYYVIMTAGEALAQGGYLPPLVGGWVANALLALVGLGLVIRSAR